MSKPLNQKALEMANLSYETTEILLNLWDKYQKNGPGGSYWKDFIQACKQYNVSATDAMRLTTGGGVNKA